MPSNNKLALSEKYVRHQDIENANAQAKLHSRQNILHREILSSEDAANHFITKTHVGGKFKNSKQVIASAAPMGPGDLHRVD